MFPFRRIPRVRFASAGGRARGPWPVGESLVLGFGDRALSFCSFSFKCSAARGSGALTASERLLTVDRRSRNAGVKH